MNTGVFYLQRLDPPTKGFDMFGGSNPFSFGGGYLNGGLSKEAMALFNQIWSYDYMGSAEFEFGALPKSWGRIQKNAKDYVLGMFEVQAIVNDYSKARKTVRECKTAPIYYFCHKDNVEEMKEWVAKFADEVKHDFRSKEFIGLGSAIVFPDKSRTQGWHDIENDYLIFTSKEMFDKMVEVLGIKED